MSIWNDLVSAREPFYEVDLRGSAGWYAPHDLDDFPLGPFASRDAALFAQQYARGLLAVLAIDEDARAPVPQRASWRHAQRFYELPTQTETPRR